MNVKIKNDDFPLGALIYIYTWVWVGLRVVSDWCVRWCDLSVNIPPMGSWDPVVVCMVV